MKITFSLGLEAGSLTIQREDGDREAKASGYTRSVHGWGAEIHLLGMIAKQMNAIGFGLARKRIACDDQFCHLYGDDDMCYLRTAIKRKRDCPHLWIVDGDYALRSSADDYNKGEKVQFNIRGNIFCERSEDSLQPDWFNKVKALCDAAGVPCKLSKNCSPPSYQVIDVQINYHYEAKLWTVSSFGFVNRNQLDDSEPIGDTDDFAEGDKEQAIAEAEGRAWLYLNQYNTRLVVVHLNGNEHVVFNLDKDNRITKSDAIEERWVFTDAELVAPENCRCDDEFNTGPIPLGSSDDVRVDYTDLGVIIQRNGIVTNRWCDGTVGVPKNILDTAVEIVAYYCESEETYADNWQNVLRDSKGNFVRFL